MLSPLKRLQVAYHEAGHAVACECFGIDHEHVTIQPNDQSAGHVLSARDGPARVQVEHYVVMLCCGYAALLAAEESEAVACEGCGSDFERASEMVKVNGLPGDLEAWKARAVAMMREPRNFAAVELVAQYLLDREKLPADYVSVLLERADGNCTEEELQQYLHEQDAVRAALGGGRDATN